MAKNMPLKKFVFGSDYILLPRYPIYHIVLFDIRSQDVLSKSIQKEVTVLASLHHPNIVKYHCAWLESVGSDLSLSNVTIVEHRESRLEEHFEFNYYRKNELPPIPNNR